jgi:hypothetical protein
LFTARDHQDLGSSLLRLGLPGQANHFHARNPGPDGSVDDQDNPNISWPDFHSGANGDHQPVLVDEPVHKLLRTARTASGRIEWFPVHPHEGSVSMPPGCLFANVVGHGRSAVTGRRFNLAVSFDGEMSPEGQPMGRGGGLLDLPSLRRSQLGRRLRGAVVCH